MEEKTLICKKCGKQFQTDAIEEASSKKLETVTNVQSCPNCRKIAKPEKPTTMGRGGTSAG